MSAIDTVRRAAEARGTVRQVGKEFLINCPAKNHPDVNPSCSFSEKEDGRVVINCNSRGCTFEAMAEGLGLKKQDFFPPKTETPHKGFGSLVATFIYETIQGRPSYKSCRHQFPGSRDKDFVLHGADDKGIWTKGIKGKERIPYRLPELNAANPDEIIFVLEGEKCVDLARDKLGLVATTSCGGHGGRNQWKLPAFAKAVKGRNLVCIPDNDKPGEEYAATVAASIVSAAKSVKIVRLPLKEEGDDLEQWLASGGTREQLIALVEAAPLYGAETVQSEKREEPETICLALVHARRNKYLWRGRLPVGEMIVITGRPGVGKGLLLCYIVARYTTGKPMHGDLEAMPAGSVLWISVEDAHDTSLAPRLDAAGADRSRVHAWNMNHALSLPTDADRIVSALKRLGCTLLIIDPAPTLLDKDHNSNNDANVRQSFCALSAACRELDCTLILVRHTNKRTFGDAMDRGGGSIGWSGMARIEMMLGRRPVEDGATVADTHESVVTFATVKNNLCKWPPSLNLAIVETSESARVEVIGETTTRADDLCAQDKPRTARKTGDAEELIRRVLADGEWHRQTEIESAAAQAEISESTLKRAKKSLGVDSTKRGPAWWWQLPKGFSQPESESHEPLGHDVACEPLHSSNNNNLGFDEGQGVQESHSHTDDPLGREEDAV